MTTEELDAVPTNEIAGRRVTLEEQREWLLYSLTVLQARASAAERKTRGLMFNPFTYFKWRRALKEWEGINDRVDAILKLKVVFDEVPA